MKPAKVSTLKAPPATGGCGCKSRAAPAATHALTQPPTPPVVEIKSYGIIVAPWEATVIKSERQGTTNNYQIKIVKPVKTEWCWFMDYETKASLPDQQGDLEVTITETVITDKGSPQQLPTTVFRGKFLPPQGPAQATYENCFPVRAHPPGFIATYTLSLLYKGAAQQSFFLFDTSKTSIGGDTSYFLSFGGKHDQATVTTQADKPLEKKGNTEWYIPNAFFDKELLLDVSLISHQDHQDHQEAQMILRIEDDKEEAIIVDLPVPPVKQSHQSTPLKATKTELHCDFSVSEIPQLRFSVWMRPLSNGKELVVEPWWLFSSPKPTLTIVARLVRLAAASGGGPDQQYQVLSGDRILGEGVIGAEPLNLAFDCRQEALSGAEPITFVVPKLGLKESVVLVEDDIPLRLGIHLKPAAAVPEEFKPFISEGAPQPVNEGLRAKLLTTGISFALPPDDEVTALVTTAFGSSGLPVEKHAIGYQKRTVSEPEVIPRLSASVGGRFGPRGGFGAKK